MISSRFALKFILAFALCNSVPAIAVTRHCEANLASANQAAAMATQNTRDARKAGHAVGALGLCALASVVVFGLDFGTLSGICTVVSASVFATTAANEDASAASQAFLKVRDPRCTKK